MALHRYELCAGEFFQVKAQRRVGDPELFNDLTRRETRLPALNDEPEDIQPRFLSKCEEGNNGVLVIHSSNYIEIL